jgi:hypothetical protein
VKQRLRSVAKRGAAPFVGVLDRRLHELAVRLERHTSQLAADHSRRLDQIDDRLRLDLRVVDEHLLAITKAAPRGASAPLTTTVGDVVVLVAPPGVLLEPLPPGMRIVAVSSYSSGPDGTWSEVAGGERTDTLRVAQLAPDA